MDRVSLSVRCGIVGLAVCLAIPLAWAQHEAAGSQQQGRLTLMSAWNAMGGSQAWSVVLDSIVTGTCQDRASEGQPQSEPEPFTWTTSGREFRYEDSASDGLKIMVSGHGKPQVLLPSGSQKITGETGFLERPFYLPGLVLQQELNEQKYRTQYIGREEVDGSELIHVRIQHLWLHTADAGSDQDWWLDPTTFLPRKIVFQLPGQAVQSYFDVTYAFTAWGGESGLVYPTQLLISAPDAGISETCNLTKLGVNAHPADSLFDAR